mgnify:FL=1|jgi:hypothetical protein
MPCPDKENQKHLVFSGEVTKFGVLTSVSELVDKKAFHGM